ncbi:MAG: hypothetical protein R2744_05520 [Bacteroidales bacterium]
MKIIAEFRNYRDQFISRIMDFPYLKREIRRDLVNFIKSYYSISSEDDILDILRANCIEINKNN